MDSNLSFATWAWGGIPCLARPYCERGERGGEGVGNSFAEERPAHSHLISKIALLGEESASVGEEEKGGGGIFTEGLNIDVLRSTNGGDSASRKEEEGWGDGKGEVT